MKVKVSLFGLSDMLKFKHLKQNRLEAINNTQIKPLENHKINELAQYYHPKKQYLVIADIIKENADTKTFVLKADEQLNKRLAYFKAGSYISIFVSVDNSVASRAYAISSSPKDALNNIYKITIKRKSDGYLSNYLLDHAKVGDKLFCGEPSGFLTYNRLRDAKNVIALAGGTGITPFLSMAKAIKDGIEDFNLTILYGVNDTKDIICKKEFDEISKECDKVKVVYVVANKAVKGYETGYLSADLIKKYAPKEEKYSLFVSGPNGLFNFLEGELKKLNLEDKYIRMEKSPQYLALENKNYNLVVHMENETFKIPMRGDETVLNALERANILIRSKCHLGGCGFCRSKIIKGSIVTTKLNKQNLLDYNLKYFHPCCSYPTSDMEIEVYKY